MKIHRKWTEKLNQQDQIFLHYTGHMFGIGCSAFNPDSIMKIHELKKRQGNKGFIVLIPDLSWLEKYQVFVPTELRRLLQQYWPGELTMILPDPNRHFKDISVDGFVAFRVPTDPFLREFIIKFGQPIVSTSINTSGKEPEVGLKEIKAQYDSWFDFGILPKNTRVADAVPSTILKYENEDLKLVREGKINFEEIKNSYKIPRILFVCTANICRSPMAEYYLREKVKVEGLNYDVKSAGFLEGGYNISENSEAILAENQMKAAKHISKQLNDDVVRKSWLILTMTDKHKKMLIEAFPNAVNKAFTLSEYAGFKQDIDDPYGLDIGHYRETFKKIKTRIDLILEKLK